MHTNLDLVNSCKKVDSIPVANGNHLSDNNNALCSLPSLVNSVKQDIQQMNEEDMESEPIPAKTDNSLDYLHNGYGNSLNNGTDITDIPMDMDCKEVHFNSNPENLDVLTKNAINANSTSENCVKILREMDAKFDLRDISNELTSTFKPSETAM